ncbi:MAG TPA: hypothetical protein VMW24_22260 [Sedimentisphaerales bacterium]|nr:hypothetical protein [Sedimentisphaerales bacterium]
MIYDCFLFYNEFMLLDLRLKELWDVVDKFVLVESNVTFTGRPKPLYFSDNMERYKEYRDKIIPLVHFVSNPDEDARENERQNRNALAKGLYDAKPDDTIILTDADEIPNKKIVKALPDVKIRGHLTMRFYYYWLNCLSTVKWHWPAFCKFGDFPEKGMQSLRISLDDQPALPDGGWHFSYLMQAEEISQKLHSFCHTEMNRPQWNNLDHIRRCRENMVDLYDREAYQFSLDDIENLPDEIRNNPERYQEYIKDYDRACCHPVL